jgi:hypothetical protein
MSELEVLVREISRPVNTRAATAIAVDEIAALDCSLVAGLGGCVSRLYRIDGSSLLCVGLCRRRVGI